MKKDAVNIHRLEDGCDVVNVNFGAGRVEIGLHGDSSMQCMHVVLHELDSSHPLGEEVSKSEEESWKNCRLFVSLNFPNSESVDNLIKVLSDYRKTCFEPPRRTRG